LQAIGRLVYDNCQLAPLKKEAWTSIKLNALNLSDSFTGKDEFLKRIQAAAITLQYSSMVLTIHGTISR